MNVILDIETISQDPVAIMANLPPWDEDSARARVPGNYKKPEAISGWMEQDKANYGKDVLEKAALHAETANVVVVGFLKNGKVEQLILDDSLGDAWAIKEPKLQGDNVGMAFPTEAELLEHAFLRLNEGGFESKYGIAAKVPNDDKVMAWNMTFEISFLVKRAWILGVPVPKTIFNPASRYPVPDRFLCLMKAWQAGDFKAPFTGLNTALKQTGLGEKNGNGADFGKLWAAEKAAALEYNGQDLLMEAKLAERMGLL